MNYVASRRTEIKPSASMAASQAARALALPAGALYAYIYCEGLLGRQTPDGGTLADDSAVARYLLNEARVSSVHGAAYGLSPYVRISAATDETTLTAATERISAAVAALC